MSKPILIWESYDSIEVYDLSDLNIAKQVYKSILDSASDENLDELPSHSELNGKNDQFFVVNKIDNLIDYLDSNQLIGIYGIDAFQTLRIDYLTRYK